MHFRRAKEKFLSDEEMAQAWAKHYPEHRAEKVSEHVCRLTETKNLLSRRRFAVTNRKVCLCIDYRVIGEISGGDAATGLDRVLASVRIAKREFDDVTDTYEPIDQIRRGSVAARSLGKKHLVRLQNAH